MFKKKLEASQIGTRHSRYGNADHQDEYTLVLKEASELLFSRLRIYAYNLTLRQYLRSEPETAKLHKSKYFIPAELDQASREKYIDIHDQILEIQSGMVTALQQANVTKPQSDKLPDLLRSVLPLSITRNVQITGTIQDLERLIVRMLSDELPECWQAGQELVSLGRSHFPKLFDNHKRSSGIGDAVTRNTNIRKTLQTQAQHLPSNHAYHEEHANLTSYWPRNELDLVADMLYEHSSLSRREIQEIVSQWPVERKERVFMSFMGIHPVSNSLPSRALEKAHYNWELVSDYLTYSQLKDKNKGEALQIQVLTPRYGYDVPQIVEDAELSDEFEECFDLSLQLHSLLQASDYVLEAQYATLHGHKLRWQVILNAYEVYSLVEQAGQNMLPSTQRLLQEMREKLEQVHPLLADGIIFRDTL